MANNAMFRMANNKREGKKQPERHPDEHYRTPFDPALIMSDMLYRYWYTSRPQQAANLIDIGADEGVWGEAFTEIILDGRSYIAGKLGGIEKRITRHYYLPENESLYDDWVVADATDLSNYPPGYNIAFGNPPFLKEGQGRAMNDWVKRLIDKFEVVAFLLRTDFVGGKRHYDDLFAGGKLAVMAQSIHRIHFEGHGSNNYREFAWYIWDKKHQAAPMLSWFDYKNQTIDPYFLEKYP